MPELSLQNIDQISRDIKRQEITFSHLVDELTDHICCDVEYEMQNGLEFTEAYRRVINKIGSRRLKEIQEETLYAVDTKYRQMKNTMKISGIAGTVMLGFAAILKIMHWPGAGILLVTGAFTLALIFMPSALGVLWKETRNSKKIFLYVSAFLAGMFYITGVLFKVQHWPGAGIMLSLAALSGILFFIPALLLSSIRDQDNRAKKAAIIIGAAGSVFFVAGIFLKIQHWPMATLFMVCGLFFLIMVAFPLFTWFTWKEESHVSSMFIFMVIGSLLVIIPGALVNLNLQNSYQRFYYPNNNQQNALYDYLYNNNNAFLSRYHDSLSYSKLNELNNKTKSILLILSNIQEKMVQESEGEPGKPAVSTAQIRQNESGKEILYSELTNPFHPVPVRDFLLPGCMARKDINLAMADYLNFLTGMIPAGEVSKYKNLLEPSTYLPGEEKIHNDISLMSGLHSLEIMKNGILTVESCVLNEMIEHK